MYCWVVFLALFFPIGSLAAFIVDTPTKSALTCEPLLLQWQGGIAPWTLSVLQASNSQVLENLGTLKVTSFAWNVDLAAGTSVVIQLTDSTGQTATSNPMTVQLGNTDCTLSTVATRQTSTSTTSTQATVATTSTPTLTLPTSTPVITFSASITTTRSTTVSVTTPTRPSATSQSQTSTTIASSSSNGSPSSTPPVLISQGDASATASGSQTGSGVYSTVAPETHAPGTPASVGVALGILIPGLMLLLFFGIFLLRRHRMSSTAGIEGLEYAGTQDAPAWFMRPSYHPAVTSGAPPSRVSYGLQSSGSYRTSLTATRGQPSISVTVPSTDSVSSLAPFEPSPMLTLPTESGSAYSVPSTARWSQPSSASGDQRMMDFRFPGYGAVTTPRV
ncbi:hypothetical protein B0H10DRAFT_1987481 [Mycena sp. CBHHK59/15]|nr:hypothetical protein B0H10DRAFT_1987481 [Mycena sp. CBHHK59/15]